MTDALRPHQIDTIEKMLDRGGCGGIFNDVLKRFWAKIDTSGGDDACWPWIGALSGRGGRLSGYGQLRIGKHLVRATHIAYELAHPDSFVGALFVLHSCDNPPCCNPRHLSLGDGFDNQREAVARKRQWNTRKTHCRNGHPYSEENTYTPPASSERQCRTCKRETLRALRAKRKEATVNGSA